MREVLSWAYTKTFPKPCDEYLGKKTGKWFDKDLRYIICGGKIVINTKDHTAECEKCGSKWRNVNYRITIDHEAKCPFCETPDPLWTEDHSKHCEDEIKINCPKCGETFFIVIRSCKRDTVEPRTPLSVIRATNWFYRR